MSVTKSRQYLSLCLCPYQYLRVYTAYRVYLALYLHLHGHRGHTYVHLHDTCPDIYIHTRRSFTNSAFTEVTAKEGDTNFSLTTDPF